MDNAKEHLAPKGVKLTAVTIYKGPWRRYTVFVPLPHDSRGKPIMAQSVFAEVQKRHAGSNSV